MKYLLLFLLASCIASSNTMAQTNVADHKAWDVMLKKFVTNNGTVNYKDWKKSEKDLDGYLMTLSKNPPQNNWNKNEKLAFWINAYNANTIKKILKAYPIESITKLDNGKPWDVVWIKIGDKTYSLNNIENDIIRVQFKEPRIHFAVNCAAKSCPPLLNKAWTSENLETNLESRAKSFINDKSYNEVGTGSANISKIFDWYKVDFGDVKSFVNKYTNSTDIGSKAKIGFKEYNWELNQ